MCRCLKACYPNEVASVTWNSPEEMCLFEIDESSLESHMPLSVLAALKMLRKQIEEDRTPGRELDHFRKRAQESDLPQEPDEGIEMRSVKVVVTDPMTDDVNASRSPLVADAEVHY